MTSAIYQELSERAAVIYEKVVMWRRDFHRYPELAGHEERTSGLVAEHLRALGLEVAEHVGGFGVVGLLRGEAGNGPVIGFRADMIKDGVLENPRVDILLGMHLLFNPAGTLAFKRGYALTASDSFTLTITGKGGHGAKPHETNDVVLTACKAVENLHQIVSRKINPQRMAILSVGSIQSGTASNVLPETATIRGTVRTLETDVQEQMIAGVRAAAQSACDFTGAEFNLDYRIMEPAVHNDDAVMAHITDVFRQMLGEDSVIELTEPRCGSEDFSNYQRPGVQTGYFWLGGAYPGEAHPSTNHQPRYNWDERTMRTGVQAACAAVCSYLIAD